MSMKVRKSFNDVVSLHDRLIRALKAQKVRQDQMLQKYSDDVQKEVEIPSNRFMRWSLIMTPFMDSVVSSKLMDFELIQAYEKFIKDIVTYEASFVITEEQFSDIEYGFDSSVEVALRLEKKIMELKQDMKKQLVRSQLRAIELNQDAGGTDGCSWCGVELNEADGASELCAGCQSLPKEIKDRLRGGSAAVNAEESPEETEPEDIPDDVNDTDGPEGPDTEETVDMPETPETTEKETKLKEQFQRLMSGFDKKYKGKMGAETSENKEED